jgi:putative restriction endonuclease
MPAIQPQVLTDAVLQAVQESGFVGALISPVRSHPRRFSVVGPDGVRTVLSVYIWTLTFGGRPKLVNEFRVQMTSVASPLPIPGDGPAVLLGYEPTLRLFAGFDLARHRKFTTGSPSVQIDIEVLRRAETEGLSFHRKSNDEIAIGIRPDQLMTYALNAESLHRYGREASTLRLLTRAAAQMEIPARDIASLSTERRRIVQAVSRLSRLASFRRQVLFAYGDRCAVTRVQLRLVDAAHILPVGAPESADNVRNGIALAPTYHRAFDNGLIYLDEGYQMRVNAFEIEKLAKVGLDGGVEAFRVPLGKIFLPPDPGQRPAVEYIRRANRVRGIPF